MNNHRWRHWGGDKGRRHHDHAAVVALARSLAAEAEQRPGLTVETRVASTPNGSYNRDDDLMTVTLLEEWDATTQNVASCIAHELGHRAEPADVVRRARSWRKALAFWMLAGGVLLAVVVGWAAMGPASRFSFLLVAILVWLVSVWGLGLRNWSREYAADAYSAAHVGKDATLTGLHSLKPGWTDPEHPPRRFRIARVKKLADA